MLTLTGIIRPPDNRPEVYIMFDHWSFLTANLWSLHADGTEVPR